MRFERLYRATTANVGLKLISLLFAVLLWLYVTAQQTEKHSFAVPLELSNVPDSLTVLSEVPSSVEVAVSGTKSELLKLRFFGKVRAIVDCSTAKRGNMVFPLSTGVLRLPHGFTSTEVTVENPRSLNLGFERVERRYVPVRAVFKGELDDDITFVGRPVIVPDRVLVSGASSAMVGVTSVPTEEIDLQSRRGRISQEVELRLGGRRISVVPDKVLVEIELSKRAVRTLTNITPTLLQGDERFRIECSPRTASLTVEGPEDLVKKLVPEEVSIVLTVAMRKKGTYRVRPEVIVPAGIERYTLNVDTFEVTISPREGGGG